MLECEDCGAQTCSMIIQFKSLISRRIYSGKDLRDFLKRLKHLKNSISAFALNLHAQ